MKMMIMTTMKPMMKITMINWATWVRESGSEWLLQISLHQPKISAHSNPRYLFTRSFQRYLFNGSFMVMILIGSPELHC